MSFPRRIQRSVVAGALGEGVHWCLGGAGVAVLSPSEGAGLLLGPPRRKRWLYRSVVAEAFKDFVSQRRTVCLRRGMGCGGGVAEPFG